MCIPCDTDRLGVKFRCAVETLNTRIVALPYVRICPVIPGTMADISNNTSNFDSLLLRQFTQAYSSYLTIAYVVNRIPR